MRNISFVFTIILLFSQQVIGQAYWQQEVNYTLDVRLDDVAHTLQANETFEYINHSPDVLHELYIHLWPNAYRDKHSALAKQLYQNGASALYYGPEADRGSIDGLAFKIDGQTVTWRYDEKHQDICILTLNTPLAPGGRLVVSTPFHVKIPSGTISRLGHIDQSYQITQWYPKPAVYDKHGWNPIPYLNQGEFYSEYGSFDVSITLPSNYVIGATGDLQTASEKTFLDARAKEQSTELTFPKSDSTWKTVRYTQSRVHDFAWFADKRFIVRKGEVALPHSGRKVTTWAMYTPQNASAWENAIEYINDGTYFYSKWNGDYPYNQVTAIDGTISAGGGMEYPNVTVIGSTSDPRELEVVIVHEVGHNWFYGILGTNERVHGWMDEGINTLNEIRYVQTKYPENADFSKLFAGKLHMKGLNHHDLADISYRGCAMLGIDQPIETHSADFTSTNYGAIMYEKTGAVFYYLKDYLGDNVFDSCMRTYFDTWKFKHPEPADLRQIMETVSGKELSWFFNDLIQTTNYIDYAIKRVKPGTSSTRVKLRNTGNVNGPIQLNAFKNGEQVLDVWVSGEKRSKIVELNLNADQFDVLQLDATKDIPELYRQNNTWIASKAFHRIEPIRFEALTGDHEADKTTIFWTPALAANAYDKLMIGAVFHNYGVPFNRFQYLVAPLYSTGRNMISGIGEFTYSMHPKGWIQLSNLGLSIKSFKTQAGYTSEKQAGSYFAVAPRWSFKFRNHKHSPFSQQVNLQGIANYDINSSMSKRYAGGFARYTIDFKHPDHQVKLNLRNDVITGKEVDLSRFSSELTYAFRYLRKRMKRTLELRAFYGNNYAFRIKNNSNPYPYSLSMQGATGQQDLFLEDYFIDRMAVSGMWSQQRLDNMGGFHTSSWYGNTTTWIASTNVYVPLPIPKLGFLGAFADLGAFGGASGTQTLADAGIGLRVRNILGVYMPLYLSGALKNSFVDQGIAERIRFSLKLNLVNNGIKLPF